MHLRTRLVHLRPQLLAFARSLTLDPAAAEDLVHDAFVRALQSPGFPSAPDEVRPWMFRILRNLFIDDTRRERIRRRGSAAQAHLSDTSVIADVDLIETMLVRQAFARLTACEREIIGLIDILGLSYAEAARVHDVPVGTVMSRLSRARRAMIVALGESNIRPIARRSNSAER